MDWKSFLFILVQDHRKWHLQQWSCSEQKITTCTYTLREKGVKRVLRCPVGLYGTLVAIEPSKRFQKIQEPFGEPSKVLPEEPLVAPLRTLKGFIYGTSEEPFMHPFF